MSGGLDAELRAQLTRLGELLKRNSQDSKPKDATLHDLAVKIQELKVLMERNKRKALNPPSFYVRLMRVRASFLF